MTSSIRLQLDGLPQKALPMATFILGATAAFCSQPETFPVFHAWLTARTAAMDAPAAIRGNVGDLTPGIIAGFYDFLTDGLKS
jgi:hypothetical protein